MHASAVLPYYSNGVGRVSVLHLGTGDDTKAWVVASTVPQAADQEKPSVGRQAARTV